MPQRQRNICFSPTWLATPSCRMLSFTPLLFKCAICTKWHAWTTSTMLFTCSHHHQATEHFTSHLWLMGRQLEPVTLLKEPCVSLCVGVCVCVCYRPVWQDEVSFWVGYCDSRTRCYDDRRLCWLPYHHPLPIQLPEETTVSVRRIIRRAAMPLHTSRD